MIVASVHVKVVGVIVRKRSVQGAKINQRKLNGFSMPSKADPDGTCCC